MAASAAASAEGVSLPVQEPAIGHSLHHAAKLGLVAPEERFLGIGGVTCYQISLLALGSRMPFIDLYIMFTNAELSSPVYRLYCNSKHPSSVQQFPCQGKSVLVAGPRRASIMRIRERRPKHVRFSG